MPVMRARCIVTLLAQAFGAATTWCDQRSPPGPGRFSRGNTPSTKPGALRCRFLITVISSSLPARNVGRKTLINHGSTDRGQVNAICRDASFSC